MGWVSVKVKESQCWSKTVKMKLLYKVGYMTVLASESTKQCLTLIQMLIKCEQYTIYDIHSFTFSSLKKYYYSAVMMMRKILLTDRYLFLILLQTALISLDGLSKFIELDQLTSDLGGSFKYDHFKWINMRMVGQEIF